MAVEVNPLVLLVSFALALVAPTLTVYLLLAYRIESGLQDVQKGVRHDVARLRKDLREHAAGERERVEAIAKAYVDPRQGEWGPEPVERPPALPAGQAPATRPPDPRYLVVDDSAAVRGAVQELLGQEGVEPERVQTAGNAAEALELFRKHRPEIVLLDADLPDLDGHHVARQMQALSPEVLVVAISTLGEEDTRVRELEKRAQRVVRKPVEKRDLEGLDRLLGEGDPAGGSGATERNG